MSDFNYETEQDLLADGFVLTPEQANGLKVYEKIVHHEDADAERVYFSVATDGTVARYTGPAPKVETVAANTAPVAKAEDKTETQTDVAPDKADPEADPADKAE